MSADGGVVSLEREKRKDGPEADHLELRFEPIEGTGSGVLGVHRPPGPTGQADRLLTIFLENFAATGATKSELRAVAELPSASFHRAINVLVEGGYLANTGTAQRAFYVRGEAA